MVCQCALLVWRKNLKMTKLASIVCGQEQVIWLFFLSIMNTFCFVFTLLSNCTFSLGSSRFYWHNIGKTPIILLWGQLSKIRKQKLVSYFFIHFVREFLWSFFRRAQFIGFRLSYPETENHFINLKENCRLSSCCRGLEYVECLYYLMDERWV